LIDHGEKDKWPGCKSGKAPGFQRWDWSCRLLKLLLSKRADGSGMISDSENYEGRFNATFQLVMPALLQQKI
jgi:hypothetical protein